MAAILTLYVVAMNPLIFFFFFFLFLGFFSALSSTIISCSWTNIIHNICNITDNLIFPSGMQNNVLKAI